MHDADVLDQLSESFSGVHMDTPVETIIARGRSRQRRQLSRRIVAGAAAAVVVVLAVLLFGSHGTTPPASTGINLHLAAFTVVANSNGTATLTLIKGVPLDADALHEKLAQAGVPAVVTVGRSCTNQVADSAALDQVVSVRQQTDGSVVMVITPSAMPNRSELSIGVFPTHRTWTLVTANEPLSCTSNPNH